MDVHAPTDTPGKSRTPTAVAGAGLADRSRRAWQRLNHRWAGLDASWRRALAAAVILRVALAGAAAVFGGLLEGQDPVDVLPVPGTGFSGWEAAAAEQQGASLLGRGLERFDALWYLAIAADGYPQPTAGGAPEAVAFFPGFPLLVGAVGRLLGRQWLLAANLVALVATVAALAGVHRLVEEETGDGQLARRALIAVAVFPAAFFLLAPYSESLFLATSAWALVCAHRSRWAAAGALAAAAALTRNIGVLLVIPLVLEAWRQVRTGRRPGAGGWLAAVGGPAAGVAAFLAFGWLRYGTPLATVEAQSAWQRQWTWPWQTLVDAARIGLSTPGLFPSGYHTVDLLVFVPVAAAAVWLLMRTPLPYGAYAAAHVVIWLAYPFPGRPLMSTERFAVAIAPLGWAFGAWTARQDVAVVWRSVSAALLGVLTLLFVSWFYVF